MPRTSKKYDFDFTSVSSAIDRISVQGSTVFVNFVGNDKKYVFTWKPAIRHYWVNLKNLWKTPKVSHLESFIMNHSKRGILFKKPDYQGKLSIQKKMAKTWNNRGKGRNSSFSQRKKEYGQYIDLAQSGYMDNVSNSKRIKNVNFDYEDDVYYEE